MKIKIYENIKKEITKEIEFPYFYIQDLCLDDSESFIYGMVLEKEVLTIHEDLYYDGRISYSLEKEKRTSCFDCYFSKEHISSKQIFEEAKNRFILFFNKFY